MKNIFKFWLPLLAWCSLIFILSSIPNLKTDLGGWDLILRKIAHITEYAILYLLTLRAFDNTGPQQHGRKTILAAFIFAVLYACSDEFHQSFVPGRGPSVIDVGIDSIGVTAGYFINKHLLKRKI